MLALWFPIVSLAKATTTILLVVFTLVNISLLMIKLRKVPAPEGCPNYPLMLPLIGTLACAGFVIINLISMLT
jgi:amino acid transporter